MTTKLQLQRARESYFRKIDGLISTVEHNCSYPAGSIGMREARKAAHALRNEPALLRRLIAKIEIAIVSAFPFESNPYDRPTSLHPQD